MIAERDGDEANAVGVDASGLGQLKDAVGRERADRQVVVAGPAEAAQVGAPAHHFDEKARPEFGVWSEDARRRRIDGLSGLERGLSHRKGGVHAADGREAGEATVGAVLRFVERRHVETALLREAAKQVGAARGGAKCPFEGGHEHFAFARSDDVGKRQRLGIDERHAPPMTTSG